MKRLHQLLVIIILLAIPLSAAQASTLGFAPAANYALGSYPRSVAVGDFNGDGKPDLVVANPNSASLNVRWNDGDGTFDGSSVLTYAAGMRPLSVAVDDFNGDGKPDLAAANQTSHNVSVRWNDGDGTFDDHLANYVMGSYPTGVAVGDFNGDSKPDLAVANYGSEDVSVRWNDGDGTFDDHLAAYSAGAGANSVAVGDFNGDDKPDLAIANYDGGTVSVRWNDGDGTFDDHLAAYSISGYPDSVAVGDFNGDGKLDLATANDMGYTVSVLWNDGDGTFDDHPATYSAGARPVAVAVDDFNGDGKPDLAIANYSSSSVVSVLWNDGDGTFDDLRTTYAAGSYPNSVAVEDFNGNGKPDLAAASDSSVSVLLNALKGDTLTTLAGLPASATYGDTLTLTATVTADIPGTPVGEVQFKDNGVDLGSPVPLTDGQAIYTTSALAAGDHSLTAEFLANEDYNGSTSDPQTVTVNKAPLTITVDDKDKLYGARFPTFTLSYSGFVNGETSSVLGGQLVLITSAHWYDSVGDYPVEVDGLTSDNYDIIFAPGILHITPAPLTVTADDKTKIYGDPLPEFTASYSGFVMGQTPSVLAGTLTFSTSPEATQASPVGSYEITPGGLTALHGNYTITFAPGTLTITPVDTTTTLASSANPSTYGTDVTFTATVAPASASSTVAFKADGDAITGCGAQAVSGGQATCTTSAITAGTHVITAEYGGDANHNPSTAQLSPDQQVTRATATITLGSLTQTYDGTPRHVTVTTAPPGVNVDVTYDGSATAPTDVGMYAVLARVNDPNYQGEDVSDTLTIEKANVEITLSDMTWEYDGTPKHPTAVTDPPGLTVAFTYDGSPTEPSAPGTYPLVATADSSNYHGTTSGTFIIHDTTPPVVTSFVVPASSSTLDIPITEFTASDLNGVDGFLITGSDTPPPADDTGWSGTAPETYHVTTTGTHTLYPWARDNANNISAVFGSPRTVQLCFPTVIVTTADNSGPGSLRQAIIDVCPDGTITFDGDYAVPLGSVLTLDKNMTIDGSGHTISVSGEDTHQVFSVNGGVTATLQHLTITRGRSPFGGGLSNNGTLTVTDSIFLSNRASWGGAVWNPGSLTITNTTFDSNFTEAFDGAGIYNNQGTLTVRNSTFVNNHALSNGGAIFNSLATAAITNSTFTGNWANQYGGGIYNYNNSTLRLSNDTFSNNRGDSGGADVTNRAATLHYANTIMANPLTGVNCHVMDAGVIGTNVNNLVETNTGCGTPAFSTDLNLTAALAANGGSTQTMALLPGSPAIDAGSDAICAADPVNSLDQRGVARPQGTHCDIGAFESQGFTLGSLTGTPQSAAINTGFASPLGLTVTANDPIEPVAGGRVTFTPTGSGASAVITGSPAIIATGGTVSVTATANGTAGGPYNVTASASGATSVDFALTNDKGTATVTIENLYQMYDGTAKQVTVTTSPPGLGVNITYGGLPDEPTNAGSYTVLATVNDSNYQGTKTETLVVNRRPITVAAAPDTKLYDGTTASSSVPTITSGTLAAGDDGTWTQTFDTPDAGTGKTLIPAGTVNDGNSGLNYSVTFVSDTTGAITARPITVTAATDTKVYDGTTTSGGLPTLTSGTLVGDDTAAWTQTFDTKDAGTGKTLTPAGTVDDGNGGLNYLVTFNSVTTGIIDPVPLTITAENAVKYYSAPLPTFTVAYSGFVGGDTESVLGGGLTFNTDATQTSPLGTYPVTPAGLTSTNYIIAFAPGTLTIIPLGAGVHDDADPVWAYTGGWRTYNGTGPSANTMHYTYGFGDSAQTFINGAQFRLTYTASPNYGIVDVYVDDVRAGSFNQNSTPSGWQKTWTSNPLTAGVHEVRLVKASSGLQINLDAIQVMAVASTVLQPGKHDDPDAALTYSTGWFTASGLSGPYSGTLHYTYGLGNSVQTFINGAQFKLTYTASSNYGIVDVYVDDVKVASINQNSSPSGWQKTWTSNPMTAGIHKVRLVKASSGLQINLDAIEVLETASTVLGPGKHDNLDAAFSYSSGWFSLSGMTGPYLGTLHYTYNIHNSAQVFMNGTQFRLIYTASPNYGLVDVYIDDVKVATIDQNSSPSGWQKTWTSNPLTAGIHKVKFVKANSGLQINIDAIEVLP